MTIKRPDRFSECKNCSVANTALISLNKETNGGKDLTVACSVNYAHIGPFKFGRARIHMTRWGEYSTEAAVPVRAKQFIQELAGNLSLSISTIFYEHEDVTGRCPAVNKLKH